jgi:hypothetical protein
MRRGVIWFGDYPNLKSCGPTVWNPESKRVGEKLGFDCLFLSLSFEYEVYLAFLALGWLVVAFLCRCLISSGDAASPAFEPCECMNIEDRVLRKT